MTIPQALIIASVIVGASIVGARLVAPYEIAAGNDGDGNPMLWRANTITGKVEICMALSVVKDRNPFEKLDPAHRPPCE
jgi:hypothetical protein